ncbi:MAG: HEPN domain-containing protein [Actinomycetota bacterium]
MTYLEKAKESVAAAERAVSEGQFTVAGNEAILGIIAANDAAMGLVFKVVSDSPNHSDAVGVFRERFDSEDDLKYSKYLTRLLNKKQQFMYEGRILTSTEASGMAGDARTFLDWVEKRTKDLI